MRLEFVLSLVFCLTITASYGQSVTTVAGPFNASGGVKLGPDGKVYIADFGLSLNNANGRVVWTWDQMDSLQVFAVGLQGASGNDFNSKGELIQSNIAGNRISRIDKDGTVSTLTSTGIVNPVGILVSDEDDIYICNCGNNTIRKLSSDGTNKLFAAGFPLNCPNGITSDDEGNLYVSNFSNGHVIAIDSLGGMSILATIPGNNNGHLVYANEVLYVCSHGSSRIYEVKLDGSYRILAGSGIRGNEDGPFAAAQFSRPNGIAATPDGDTLYLNSSVPVTDAGGRPLNPSLLRMITGVRDFTLRNDDDLLKPGRLTSHFINGNWYVRIKTADSFSPIIQLIDLNGRILYSRLHDIESGVEYEFIIPDQESGPAVRILNLKSNDQAFTVKLMKP